MRRRGGHRRAACGCYWRHLSWLPLPTLVRLDGLAGRAGEAFRWTLTFPTCGEHFAATRRQHATSRAWDEKNCFRSVCGKTGAQAGLAQHLLHFTRACNCCRTRFYPEGGFHLLYDDAKRRRRRAAPGVECYFAGMAPSAAALPSACHSTTPTSRGTCLAAWHLPTNCYMFRLGQHDTISVESTLACLAVDVSARSR